MKALFTVTQAHATTALTGASQNLGFSTATFFAISGFPNQSGAYNSGAISFGSKSGQLPYILAPGASVTLTNVKENLGNFYFRGFLNDGLYVTSY